MRSYPCRCVDCRARKTLAKQPVEYKVRKYATCHCGGELRIDWYRKRVEHKKNLCRCFGYPFPHRAGGGIWCRQHPVGPSEQDWIERYGQQYAG